MDGSCIWAKGTPGQTQDQQSNPVEESPFTPPKVQPKIRQKSSLELGDKQKTTSAGPSDDSGWELHHHRHMGSKTRNRCICQTGRLDHKVTNHTLVCRRVSLSRLGCTSKTHQVANVGEKCCFCDIHFLLFFSLKQPCDPVIPVYRWIKWTESASNSLEVGTKITQLSYYLRWFLVDFLQRIVTVQGFETTDNTHLGGDSCAEKAPDSSHGITVGSQENPTLWADTRTSNILHLVIAGNPYTLVKSYNRI